MQIEQIKFKDDKGKNDRVTRKNDASRVSRVASRVSRVACHLSVKSQY